ncbi:hypothetical protein CgunFtcFv8_015934 [Champsocephalus gunnari]|nr:hypothetical protein CgunFtcFv8_015934 [Champsocephalus gunnari]
MFALPRVFKKLKLDDSPNPELGSGFGEGSGNELDLDVTPSQISALAVNDLPENTANESGPNRDVLPLRTKQMEEMEGETFSGNGMTEMETHHDSLLRFQEEREEEEEDIFHAQHLLPFSPKASMRAAALRRPIGVNETFIET